MLSDVKRLFFLLQMSLD